LSELDTNQSRQPLLAGYSQLFLLKAGYWQLAFFLAQRKKRGRYAGCSDLTLSPFALVETPLKHAVLRTSGNERHSCKRHPL